MAAIEIQGLRKAYGRHLAVDGVSFSVSRGEIVGFLGPNGAGKSTTLKILTGFLAPTEGRALIEGIDVLERPIETQRRIGYLPENAPIYPDMRVGEYLEYIGKIRQMGRSERSHAIERVGAQCGILERMRQPVGQLSKGYRQRVGLAQAMLHDPEILVLDEPTTGLDPNQIVEIRNLVKEIGKRKTIILSTHILPEVQAACSRVVIIHQGRLAADGPVDEVITRSQGGTSVAVTYADASVALPKEELEDALSKLDGIGSVKPLPSEPGEHRFELLASGDVRASLFRLAVDRGLSMLELAPAKSDLEDVFRRLTEQSPERQ
jgi:ABC-2 type transport system ATP-binding protein